MLEAAPALSIVIPMLDESGNVLPLIEEITAALKAYAPVGDNFESSASMTAAAMQPPRKSNRRSNCIRTCD
jgi:hypothetical protein